MLQNEIIRYIYVYTGRYADLNLIDAILVKAEEIYETQLWKKVNTDKNCCHFGNNVWH